MAPKKDAAGGTRRIKRKIDDIEKASPPNSSKRASFAGASKEKKAGRSRANGPTKSSVKNPEGGSISRINSNLSKQEQKQLLMLQQKAANTAPSPHKSISSAKNIDYEEEQNDSDKCTPTKRSLRAGRQSATMKNSKKKTLRSTGKHSKQPKPKPDVRIAADDPEVSDESDENESEEESQDEPDDDGGIVEVEDFDGGTGAPRLGDSDGEQDVSFNDDAGAAVDDAVEDEPSGEHDLPFPLTQPAVQPSKDAPTIPTTIPVLNSVSEEQRAQLLSNNVDESIIIHVADMIKRSITNQLNSSFDQITKEIRADRTSMKQLQENVSELTSVVMTTVSSVFFKHAASQPRQKEIQKKLCLLPVIFNDQLMLKILPRVIIGFLVTSIVHGSSFTSLQDKGTEFFAVLFFSKQPNETKREKFASKLGQVYSKFRFSLLISSFYALQNNTFQTFRNENILTAGGDMTGVTGAEHSSTVGPSICAITQPFWLRPGYVLSRHCTSAANKAEKAVTVDVNDEACNNGDSLSQTIGDNESMDMQDSSQSSGKSKLNRTGPLLQDEIATEAAGMVYKIITSMLKRSRHAIKIQLFHDLTYLFTGWDQHGVSVDQRTLQISWEADLTGDIDYIGDIPQTKVILPHERHLNIAQEADQADIENLAHLQTVIARHLELPLKVQHDVMVNGNVCQLNYSINLIEVACRSLAAYTTLETASKGKDALCADKRCLKSIIVLAIGLRKLLDKAISDLSLSVTVPWSTNSKPKARRGRPKRSGQQSTGTTEESEQKYMFEVIGGTSLDMLQPAPSKQKEILNNLILNMTQEEYAAKTVTQMGTSPHTANERGDGGAVVGSEGLRIEADESLGVFGF